MLGSINCWNQFTLLVCNLCFLCLFINNYLNSVRFQFVASPKCQYILNEIIYRGWRNWQDKGILRKASWFLIQFVLVAITCFVYIPVRLLRRCCGCGKVEDICCWKFRKLYELPYSKFINHTMSYVLFLCLVFASSFQDKFGTTKTGLAWIGKLLLSQGNATPLDILSRNGLTVMLFSCL